ncbi:MAG: TonB-dependent receptor [Alphaproteobacteria bacterium HGW-Alphaproteobacteria-18]|nr:MAG: TonB-dependent receptor [Alphaproteobacteria bacterium HGW-Alphaproteobacteria-18]
MKRHKPLSRIVFSGASALAIAVATPAIAQETTAPEAAPQVAPAATDSARAETDLKLGSITVTANRREQSAQDVPMAIQAFGEDTLSQLQINSVEDLSSVVPGFNVSQSYQGVPTYTLRGIGFNTINLSATSTVGTYVDEVAYPYPFMNSGPVFDVSRVEVLKGPQGTLFGRNTTAGLINVVTNKPVDEFQARVKAEVGNYDTWNLEGMINLPLSENIQARFAIRSENSDEGWQRSVSRPDEDRGTVDKLGFRAALAIQPSDKMDIDLSYNGWINKSDTIGGQGIGLTPNTDPTFIVPGTSGPSSSSAFNQPGLIDYLANNFPTSAKQSDWAPYNARSATVGGVPGIDGDHAEDSSFHALRAGVSYTFDNDLKLVSLTGYNKLEREAVLDWSGVPFQILLQDIDGEIKSFSQELRLEGETGRANWLVGAYYGKDETTDTNRTMLRDNANSNFISTVAATLAASPFNVDPETGQPYTIAELLNSFQTYRDAGDFESTTQSIFANVDWEITPEFSLTTGIRYTEDQQKYIGCSSDVNGSMQPNVNVFNRTYFALIYGLTTPTAPLIENGCNTYDVATNSFGPVASDTKENNVSWRIAGNWTPTNNMLLFASVTQGYKSASTPVNAASKSEQNAPATQESLLAYEAGIKAQLFNQRLQTNASVFFYDYEDKQVASFFPDPIYRALSRLQNVPKSEAYGFETEITWLVNENLTAMGGLTLLQTEIKEFDTSDAFGLPTSRAGDPFLYSPETSATLALLYDRPVTETLGLRGSISGRWQSDSTAGDPDDPLYDIDSYGTLNGSIGLYTLNDTWEFSLWGQNLTDEYYVQQVTSNANVVLRFAGKPRTYGASLSYRF